jgi:threonine synthase
MKYKSTRDTSEKLLTFSDVLLKGLAEDGGLYIPESYPIIKDTEWISLRNLPYSDLAFEIMSRFIDSDFSRTDLKDLLKKTYTKDVFGSEEITPISHLWGPLYLQDLSSGPSLAFKDMAMQFLGHIMDYELKRIGETLTILGASSGDTVSAAEEAMKGKSSIRVVMLTPKDGMSPFQKAQAGSILEDNIFNLSVPGPFDVCQDLVKSINRDIAFKKKYKIGAVNSINWCRILAQIVYYFNAYFMQTKTMKESIDVVVPSGNFGNILAAYVAKKMGLPIRRLIVATNENDVLDTFFKTGIYRKKNVQVTSSPSMDISKASNIERLFYDILGRDPQTLSKKMAEFESTGMLDFTPYLEDIQIKLGFYSGQSTHNERKHIIQEVYKKTGHVIDPHTAASVKVALDYKDDSNIPMICVETAKPAKFEAAIIDAIGITPERPSAFIGLEDREQRFFSVEATEKSIKSFIETHLH